MSSSLEEYFQPKIEPPNKSTKNKIGSLAIWISATGLFAAVGFTMPILGVGYQNSLNNAHTEYISGLPERTLTDYLGDSYDKELTSTIGAKISKDLQRQAEKKFNKAYTRYANGKIGFLSIPYMLEKRKNTAIQDFNIATSDKNEIGFNALNNTISMICKDKSYLKDNDLYDFTTETEVLNIDLNRASSATQFVLENYLSQLKGDELKEQKEILNDFFYEKISSNCPLAY